MAKGYWIAQIDVKDADDYAGYVKGLPEPLARYGARYLVRGGAQDAVEGSARARNVVIEFPSYQAALACYRDPDYRKVKPIRERAAESDLLIIEGYDGAQPGN